MVAESGGPNGYKQQRYFFHVWWQPPCMVFAWCGDYSIVIPHRGKPNGVSDLQNDHHICACVSQDLSNDRPLELFFFVHHGGFLK